MAAFTAPRPAVALITSAATERNAVIGDNVAQRAADIPIVQLNPGGTLNWKYKGETALRTSGLSCAPSTSPAHSVAERRSCCRAFVFVGHRHSCATYVLSMHATGWCAAGWGACVRRGHGAHPCVRRGTGPLFGVVPGGEKCGGECRYSIVRPTGLIGDEVADAAKPYSLEFSQGDVIAGRLSRADVACVVTAALQEPAAVGATFEVRRAERWGVGGPATFDAAGAKVEFMKLVKGATMPAKPASRGVGSGGPD